jgi:16S rRNA (cytidine1402-2'-O)-methyltransferase
MSGIVWVVATPIGNLADLSPRAVAVLQSVDLIACENPRHSATLLAHAGIARPLKALNEHSEAVLTDSLLAQLRDGRAIGLISDAGTPLISDPGFRLIRAARDAGIEVRPVPGPCAAIAALSVAGIESDRFWFEGFLPASHSARRARIDALRGLGGTLVFYEAPHRIDAALADLAAGLGATRRALIGREMTKQFETFLSAPLAALAAQFADPRTEKRGEFVVIVEGQRDVGAVDSVAADVLFRELDRELGPSQAARIVAKLTGRKRNEVYRWHDPSGA